MTVQGKAVSTPELSVPKELLDQLVKGPMNQGDLESMFRSLNKAVIERAVAAEMSGHLGYGQYRVQSSTRDE
jgi:putative transposase